MEILQVGKLYRPDQTQWPEAAEYNFTKSGHELRFFWSRITTKEVLAVSRGRAEFALYDTGALVMLCYRFGGMPWSDVPFNIYRVPDAVHELPTATLGEERALLQVVLVEANTGIIKALRQVSFSPDFTRKLHDAIQKQALPQYAFELQNPAIAEALQSNIYALYPGSDKLAAACKTRCQGGD